MKDYLNKLSNDVIGAAIEVHRELGSGLLELTYELALQHELCLRGISSTRQVLPFRYKDLELPDACRTDLLVGFLGAGNQSRRGYHSNPFSPASDLPENVQEAFRSADQFSHDKTHRWRETSRPSISRIETKLSEPLRPPRLCVEIFFPCKKSNQH